MNPQSHNKVPTYKIALIFSGCMLVVNIIVNLISHSFKPDSFLRWDYFTYSIILEGLGLFVTAALSKLITSKLMDFTFGTIVIRILVFSILYMLLALFVELVIFASYFGADFDLYHPNLTAFNSGMRCSFLFLVVWMVLKYRTKVAKEDDSHI